MPVFSEYLYTFFKEKNSQEMAKKWGKSRCKEGTKNIVEFYKKQERPNIKGYAYW